MEANLLAVPTRSSLHSDRDGNRGIPIDIRMPQRNFANSRVGKHSWKFLAAVPAGAIILFEVRGNNSRNSPHHADLATNMEVAESPPFPHPSRRRNSHR
jgi:hypothetical protein